MSLIAGAKSWGRIVSAVALLCALAGSLMASVPTVPLGRAANFAVLAGAFNNTGTTLVTGDVGVPPGGVVQGFPPGTINGVVHTGDVASADAQADLTIAFNDAAARTPNVTLLTSDVGGLTLTAGVYRASANLEITSGDLTLDGRGDPNAVFIFQIPGSFTTSVGRRVLLTGSARSSRIFWQVSGGIVYIETNSIVKGNFLVDALMTLQNGAELEGRALSHDSNGVIVDTALIRLPSGGAGAAPPGIIVIDSASSIVLNPQTGLMEQTIRVRNAGSNAVAAAVVWMKGLTNVTVYNATGKTANGHPFVQYNLPLAVGDSVDMVIEYLRPSRLPFRSPTFVTNASTPIVYGATVGQIQPVLRKVPVGTDRMLVEFTARPGQRFSVQYSDDGRIWKTAHPSIKANADRVWWVDYGAPKTEGKPTGSRAYRVVKLL